MLPKFQFHFTGISRVYALARLVQEQYFWTLHQDTRKKQFLLIATN